VEKGGEKMGGEEVTFDISGEGRRREKGRRWEKEEERRWRGK